VNLTEAINGLDDPARGPLEGLALLTYMNTIEIKHLDHKLIGALSILSPEAVREALRRIIRQEERNGS